MIEIAAERRLWDAPASARRIGRFEFTDYILPIMTTTGNRRPRVEPQGAGNMRNALLCLTLVTSLFGVAGCQVSTNPNSPALQAMNNPPNACGPGGTAAIEQCSNRR